VATDLTPAMLSAARALAAERGTLNVEFAIADAEELPFGDSSFDLVTCRIAAHHFPHPEHSLREVKRVLRPGGLFLLQDQVAPEDETAAMYVNGFERRRDPSHVRALGEHEWKQGLSDAGLALETVDRFEKRIVLEQWAARQGSSAEDLAELRARLITAPSTAQGWMVPLKAEGPEASFLVHQCLFGSRKGAEPEA
jgi:ubiquinone/menaquinone biosynthesis C-methylase UbiE